MIAAFARKLGTATSPPPAHHATDYDALAQESDSAHDAPPERFVEKYPHEGGDVFLAPLLDSLRAALRAARREPRPKDAEPGETVPRMSENP